MSFITTLKEHPEHYSQTIALIEKAFGYPQEHKFDVDFYPLMAKDNHSNCYILLEDNTVVGHIGRLTKNLSINTKEYPINMYGGIAISKGQRGQGLFSKLFNHVLQSSPQTPLNILWSDQVELYKKFEFYPCFEMFEYQQKNNQHNYEVVKKDISNLIKDIDNFKQDHSRLKRTQKDLEKLAQIKSANLYYIYKDKKLINYFIKDKGADLENIVHEYGYIDKEQLGVFQNYGNVWCGSSIEENPTTLFATLAQINNKELYKDIIQDLYQVDLSTLSLNNEESLQGFFGPNKFQDLKQVYSFYFCGLDTI